MVTHKLKIEQDFWDAKHRGDKPFEIRHNDRGFQKGDRVLYTVVSNGIKVTPQPEEALYEITYVISYKQADNYVVFADRKVVK